MLRNAAIVLVAFLLGLIPPLLNSLRLRGELAAARTELELAGTRELAALAYLEASRNNFGIASQHASRLYQRLADAAQRGPEPFRSAAGEALARRDATMRKLATADAGARNDLQDLAGRLLTLESSSAARTQ